MKNEKHLTVETVIQHLEKAIAQDAKYFVVHDIVRSVLSKFVGKPVSKRIETALRKAAPSLSIALTNDYTPRFCIWGESLGLSYEQRMLVYLCKQNDNITLEAFEEQDACHGSAAVARNERRRDIINNRLVLSKLVEAVNTAIEARAVLRDISDILDSGDINELIKDLV